MLILVFNAVGILLWYCSELQYCKIQAQQYIQQNKNWPTQSVMKFSSLKNDFELTGSNEIRQEGNMYDIITTRRENGAIIYYTYRDGSEDKLMQEIAAYAQNNSASNNTSGKKNTFEIIKFVSSVKETSILNTYIESLTIIFNDAVFFHYSSPILSVISPPPRIIA